MNCPLHPLHSNIVVERLEDDKVTKGGIHIPDSAQKESRIGKVLAVGPGDLIDGDKTGARYPMLVKVGMIVAFGQYAGSDLKYKDKKYLLIREQDVLAAVADTDGK